MPVTLVAAIVLIGSKQVVSQEKKEISQTNPVYRLVIEHGIGATPDSKYCLPEPTLPDGASVEVHSKILNDLPGRKQSVEELMSGKAVAPFVMQHQDKNTPDADFNLHKIDVWFVAQGKLEQVYDEQFSIRLLREHNEVEKPRQIEAAELKQRGIVDVRDNERYVFGKGDVLEKIHVEAVTRVSLSKTPESVIIAGMIDPRFSNDADFPNRWRYEKSAENVDSSRFSEYRHAGYYTKITALKSHPDLLFVESHLLVEEPRQWFGGRPVLKSKLPVLFQAEVRTFRRRLSG